MAFLSYRPVCPSFLIPSLHLILVHGESKVQFEQLSLGLEHLVRLPKHFMDLTVVAQFKFTNFIFILLLNPDLVTLVVQLINHLNHYFFLVINSYSIIHLIVTMS